MTIELNSITSGYSTSLINENFEKLEQYINESLFNRDNLGVGEANQMELPLDMNGHPILNISTVGSGSLASKEYVDAGDDNLKSLLDDVEAGYQAGDANLQAQISGGTPLMASAFSEISWHGQVVENSVTIPDAKNAWSFGPKMSIADGQAVTIPDGSFWTVAEGSEPGKVDTVTANAPLVQSGTEENPVIDLPNATPTVDGAMSSEDKTKLDGVETGATADQTAAEIKTAYESNADTNAFTNADHTKLDGIEAGAEVNRAIASTAQAVAATDNTTVMTPLRTKEEVEGGNLTIDASTLNSFGSSGATAANTVPVRDASGDITTNLFRSDYAGATNPSVGANFFVTMVETGAGNNYLRPTTVAAAQNRIGQFINMPSVGGDDIVERGSNADGYWTRWADGTQVCWNDHISVTLSTSARVAVGGATLPVSFVDTAIVVTANPHGESGGWNDANDRDMSISTRVISASFIEAVCWKNSAATFAGTSGEWQYVAYGRWK